MLPDTETISFLSALDDAENEHLLMRGKPDATKSAYGVFKNNVVNLCTGAFNKFPHIQLELAKSDKWIYYQFGFSLGSKDCFYGTYSPLSEYAYRIERTLCKAVAIQIICNSFEQKCVNDPNVSERSKDALRKRFDVIVEQLKKEL